MPDEPAQVLPRPRPRDLLTPLALFGASRLVVWSAAWIAWLVLDRRMSYGAILAKWDGYWYLKVVDEGYPTAIPRGSGDAAQSTLAFFPGYPAVLRAVVAITPFGPRTAGVLVNVLCAAAASVLLWLFARRLLDSEEAATRATALFVFFPGSFVLGMVYSEGLFLLAAIGCLYLLYEGRWLVAGLVCAVATATRPTGLVVLACCAVAAVRAIVKERDLRALTAPVLGSLGFVAWTVYLAMHTEDPLTWKYAQERGWGQGLDFGRNTWEQAGRFFDSPLADVNVLVSMLMFAVLAGMVVLWAAGRWAAPAILVLFTVGILAPAILSAGLYSTARFTLTAFPLFLAVARVVRGGLHTAVVGAFAGGLALLMVVSGATYSYTP